MQEGRTGGDRKGGQEGTPPSCGRSQRSCSTALSQTRELTTLPVKQVGLGGQDTLVELAMR